MPSSLSMPHWVRLCVTGRDRARFLHNFCTNDVKSLSAGTACEAFFTDVKARIVAHGYVIAFEDRHEIWLMAGTETDLQKHLTRYIITEDVVVTMPTAQSFSATISSLVSAEGSDIHDNGALPSTPAPLQAVSLANSPTSSADARSSALTINWAGHRLTLFVGDRQTNIELCRGLSMRGDTVLNSSAFERLRIEERFPVIGRDLTSDHLAPEAERNSTAISYMKGCYLGQEPIARLDAMGHVNRALRRIEVDGPISLLADSSVQSASGAVIGSLTSVTETQEGLCCGLAVVRLAALNDELVAVTESGERYPARVLPL